MAPLDLTLPAGSDRHDAARAALAAARAQPVEGECLVCFVARRAGDGCAGWSPLESFRAARAPAAPGLPERYARMGAACACGLPGGVFVVAREHRLRDVHTDELTIPDPLPPCHGTIPGSARPCGLWVRGRRRRAGERWGCPGCP